MVQKRKKHKKSMCDFVMSQLFIIYKTSEFWKTCFSMSQPFCTLLFSCQWMYSCRSVMLQRGDSDEKQSSMTFSGVDCWSPRRNELECINLVYWRDALYGLSSCDAIMVAGFVLDKHFDGGFTPDQQKEITFTRWPPGYKSWKLSLALNGLNCSDDS